MIFSRKKQQAKNVETFHHGFFYVYSMFVLLIATFYVSFRFVVNPFWQETQALTWTKTTIDSTGSVGNYSDLAFNGSNQPIISYYDTTNTALKYAVFDGADWATETVDNTASVGLYSSIAWDSTTSKPIISYYDSTNSSLKFATRDSGVINVCTDADWSCETVDSSVTVDGTSIAFVGGTNKPAISYNDSLSVMYAIRDSGVIAACTDGDWSCETLEINLKSGTGSPVIGVDSSNVPVIFYTMNEDGGFTTYTWLVYLTRDGSGQGCGYNPSGNVDTDWDCHAIEDVSGTSGAYYSAINLNGSNNLEIAYIDSSGNLRYRESWGGATDIAYSVSSGTSLDTSISNHKIVSYVASNILYYGVTSASAWNSEIVENTVGVGTYTGIGYNSTSGKIYISYHDSTNNDLKVASVTAISNISPFVGYSASEVIPTAQVVQSASADGLVTTSFRIKDVESNSVTLNTFEYSVDGGTTWNAPTNGDASDSIYKTTAGADDWDTNGATGTFSSANSFAGTVHSFTWNTKHADLTGLSSVSQSDVRIRFKANDGTSSSSYGVSENFIVDNLAPVTNATANIATRPVGGATTVTISGTFTETNPNTNQFYAKINGGSYSGATSGTTNSASPSNQATTLLATIDGDDCVTAVKITHTDDYGNAVTNENTSPSLSCATPYTPAAPSVRVNGPESVTLTINPHASETGAVQYAEKVTSGSTVYYVQANGTLGTSADWTLTVSSPLTVRGLSASQQYVFQSYSRNPQDTTNTESSLSSSTTLTTGSNMRRDVVVSKPQTAIPQNLNLPATVSGNNAVVGNNDQRRIEVEDPEPTLISDRFMGLNVQLDENNHVVLRWTDSVFENPNVIYLYRNYSPVRTGFGLVRGLSFGQQTYTDTSVQVGKTYYYRLRAFDLEQNSIVTDPVGIKIPVPEDEKKNFVTLTVLQDFVLEKLLGFLRW